MDYFISKMNFYFPLETFNYLDIIQLIILFFVFYLIIKNMINTRAWIVIKGLFLVLFAYLFTKIFSLESISFLFEKISGLIAISIVLLFQQEIRKFFEKIGKQNFIKSFFYFKNTNEKELYYSEKTISEISKAVFEMSKVKTGALIVLEKDIVLTEYINTGIPINSDISWQLFVNIFEHNTPLHDGAVILSNDKIVAATCYLPLSDNASIDKKMGTRHRAGIGVTENSDSIVVIVSEETGNISFVCNGKIKHNITQGKLYELLYNNLQKIKQKETKEKNNKKQRTNLLSTKNIAIGISVFFSIIVWFFTININDEIVGYTFKDVSVLNENESMLNETGYTYSIKSGDKIDVTINAKRSIIEQLEKDDIIAKANFNELSITNAIPIKVNVSNEYSDYVSIEKTSQDTMILNVEDTKTVDIPLSVNLLGTEKNGYKAIINQNQVITIRVTGPESIINTLDKGTCSISIDGKSENFTSTPNVAIYDKNGTIIDYKNKNMKLTNTDIFVNVYKTKTIPIEIISAKDNEDVKYELISYESDIKEVEVAGESDYLEDFNKITIEVNSNNELSTNWDFYLPNNIYPVKNDTKINIKSQMNIYDKKTFTLSINDIKILNQQKNQNISFNNNTFSFVVYVNENLKEILNPISLEPTIDVSQIKDSKALLKFRETDGIIYDGNQYIDIVMMEMKGK